VARFVSPETVQESAPGEWHVLPSGVDTTSYPVTTLPPLNGGEPQDTRADPFDASATTLTGASGRVRGVTADDATDGRPMPRELVAMTVNVYATPLVSWVTVQPIVPAVLHVLPPGDEVAV
jgi:hypothetical protein